MARKKKAVVVGCHVTGLGVIRALGTKGIEVIALAYNRTECGSVSKYASKTMIIPHPRKEEEAFISMLVKNAPEWGGALLVDTDDDAAVTISKHKDELSHDYRMVTPNWDILSLFIEKNRTFKLSREQGVPHPVTCLARDVDEVETIRNKIDYPCILKPVRGHEFKNRFGTKNFQVNNDSELLKKFQLCLDSKQEVMIQEIIPGPDTNIEKCMMYVNSQAHMSAKFFYDKVRQNPPQFGVMRVGISRERNKEVELLSDRLLKHSGFRGVCTVEFRRDPRDHQLKLMEVNARMPRMNWLAMYCGMNFPWLVYMDIVEDQQLSIDDYTKGVYWIEFWADLLNSIFRHSKEKFTLQEYIAPYLAENKTFAVWSVKDWMPFLKETMMLPIRYRFNAPH